MATPEQTRKQLSEHLNKALTDIANWYGPDAMVATCQQLIEELNIRSAITEKASDEDWDRASNRSGWTDGTR